MRNMLLALLLIFPPAIAGAADPEVTNVAFAQRTDGSMLIDVTYDVADADGDPLAITLQASDDGGATWIVPTSHTTGDVGQGVAPGAGKSIVWNVGADLPGRELDTISVRVVASDRGVRFEPHSPALYAIMDWDPVDWNEPGIFERYARADLIVLTTVSLWGRQEWEELRPLEKIRAINPDVKIVGYVLAKTVQENWADSRPAHPFGYDMYHATEPYWCYTTTGDTLQDWFNQINVNILEPGCRQAIAGVIRDFQATTNNPLDGVFWDYFPMQLWWPVEGLFEGEADLDGDGVPHHQDPDEIAAFRQACDDLVLEVRAELGEDFIQIFNGPRGQVDPDFAALGDGIHYELFPTIGYESPTMANALDPSVPRSLFNSIDWPRTDNGGPYNFVTNIQRYFYNDDQGVNTLIDLGDLNRVVGLLTGAYASWNNQTGNYAYGWPDVVISLGEPLGPTVIDGDDYTREFEYGRVEMWMKSGTTPNPFGYSIWVGDELVELYDAPYHFP